MSGLSFLTKVTLASNASVNPTARTSSAVAKNPENADIRIYKSGAVYPSAKLVTVCSLQYLPKDSPVVGNGFDVFSSKEFLNTKHLEEAFLFIAMVPKNKPKVDLFGSTVYDTDGQPKSDVLTQGANTKGKELLELIEAVYGITIPETGSFIDLKIVQDQPFTTDDNIYYIPKKVSRSDRKGETEMVRRENLTLYALVPIELLEGTEAPKVEEKPAETPAPIVTEEVTEKPQPADEIVITDDEPVVEAPVVEEKEALPPTLEEIDAETPETPAPAAPLPDSVLDPTASDDAPSFSIDEDDDATLAV